MADINPEEARHDPEADRKATHEHSGYSIDGDTPPAEGIGVGPTNHDGDRTGGGSKGKTTLVVLLALVVVFLVLWIIGAVVGMF